MQGITNETDENRFVLQTTPNTKGTNTKEYIHKLNKIKHGMTLYENIATGDWHTTDEDNDRNVFDFLFIGLMFLFYNICYEDRLLTHTDYHYALKYNYWGCNKTANWGLTGLYRHSLCKSIFPGG